MPAPGTPTHLARRFVSVVTADPLDPDEQRWVAGLLTPAEVAVFWAQPTIDQRHGHDAARWVHDRAGARRDLVRAALLHDVGKRHARLGAIGRSVASVLAALGLARGRHARYAAHGPLGAADLRTAGAEPLVVAYAEAHHDGRPPGIDRGDWALLDEADRVT